MEKTKYTGSSLETALADGSLRQSGTELVGMVKSSKLKEHIAFTSSGCNNWVDLPTDMIDNAIQIGVNPCKDHSHPMMKITLKEATNQEAKVLAALLSTSSKSTRTATKGTEGNNYYYSRDGGLDSHYMTQSQYGRYKGTVHSFVDENVSRGNATSTKVQSFGGVEFGGFGFGGTTLGAWGCWTPCKRWGRCCIPTPRGTRCWSCCEEEEDYDRCLWPW